MGVIETTLTTTSPTIPYSSHSFLYSSSSTRSSLCFSHRCKHGPSPSKSLRSARHLKIVSMYVMKSVNLKVRTLDTIPGLPQTAVPAPDSQQCRDPVHIWLGGNVHQGIEQHWGCSCKVWWPQRFWRGSYETFVVESCGKLYHRHVPL